MPLAVLGCIVVGKRLFQSLLMFCLTADRGNIRRLWPTYGMIATMRSRVLVTCRRTWAATSQENGHTIKHAHARRQWPDMTGRQWKGCSGRR